MLQLCKCNKSHSYYNAAKYEATRNPNIADIINIQR